MFYCKKTNSQNKKFEIGNIAKKKVFGYDEVSKWED